MDVNYPEAVRAAARREPERPALSFRDRTWTYRELLRDADSLAAGLTARGVRSGDRVVYIGENHAHLLIAMLATQTSGAVFVPLNPRLVESDYLWLLADASPTVVVLDDDCRAARAAVGPRHVLLSADGTGPESIAALLAEPREFVSPRVSMDALAMILYTSGTTGHPKGVMQTHRTIVATGIAGNRMLAHSPTDVALIMSPLFHAGAINTSPATLWTVGGHVVIAPRVDASVIMALLTQHAVTRVDTVTAVLGILHNAPGFAEFDLSGLRSLNVGGAPIPPEQLEPYLRSGVDIYRAAGMTECTVVFSLAPWRIEEKPTSIGRPLIGVQAKLRSLDGDEDVEVPDAAGEILLRGAGVTVGYWNNDEANAASFTPDGWFRTGDVAYRDQDGDYYMVDRIKDLIKTGGENVSALEVERVIAQHPDVSQVAAVGAPHAKWGETVVAVVVPKDGIQLTLEDIREFCDGRLARFKLPTRLVSLDEMPTTASGKVQKGKLRELVRTVPAE